MKHPVQNVYVDSRNVLRFRSNKIVEFLLENGSYDMNKLAVMDFDKEDREQFAQLIGYSVDGFGTLSYASNKAYRKTMKKIKKLIKKES